MLAQRRDDMTPPEVFNMLTDKCRALLEGAETLCAEPSSCIPGELAEDNTLVIGEPVSLPEPKPQPEEETAPQPEPEAVPSAQEDTFIVEEEEDAAPQPEIIQENILLEEEVTETPVEPEIHTVVLMSESQEEPAGAAEPASMPSQPASPAVQRQPVALTLNDKFRFSRALFGGSNAALNDALAAIAAIDDPADLDDYLINDLCLDPETEDAKDFIALIKGEI